MQIGNAWIDDNTGNRGMYDYFWTHALNSDETNAGINNYCDFITGNFSSTCLKYQNQGDEEVGNVDIYNIYAPLCQSTTSASKDGPSSGSVSVLNSETTLNFHPNLEFTHNINNNKINLTTLPLMIFFNQVKDIDPCSDTYVNSYLNLAEVQRALHVIPTTWSACR